MRQVRRAFGLAANGLADRAVAADLGLLLDTVRGILTNPIYVGRLRDGTSAAVAPVIDRETWDTVQRARSERRTRSGRPATRHTYALPMLECAACGRRLIGDSGRYRHPEPCPPFQAARLRRRFRNALRARGNSYPAEHYERLIRPALEAVALSASDLTEAAAVNHEAAPRPDGLVLRRLEQARERALAAYRTHRSTARLEAAMARLDAEEQRLREGPADDVPWPKVLALLRDLPRLWERAAATERRQIAEAWLTSVAAEGGRRLTIDFAGGAQAVIRVGATGFEPATS